MSTNFPGALDSLTNPTPTSDTATVSHSSQHADANDAIEALEAKVGANSSGVTTSHDYKLSLVTGSDKALPRDAVATITNKTLGTGTKVTIGSDATGDTYYREADGTLTRVPVGSTGQVMTSNGSNPVWSAPAEVNRYAVSTGSANAYIVTLTPALGSYTAGTLVQFKANFTNTGACTVNVNGLGVQNIFRSGVALTGYEIKIDTVVSLIYDGTQFNLFVQDSNPVGLLSPYAGASAPSGWLLCDGSAISRTTYATLFAVVSTTYGAGDGSTTFNLPDLRSRAVVGVGTGTKVATFSSRSSNVITVTGLTSANNNEFQTGVLVRYSTSGSVITGLINNTDYYVIRVTNTTFSLATTRSNAIAGTAITLTSDGSGTQTFTVTFTARTAGATGGEENHSLTTSELSAHNHGETYTNGSGAGLPAYTGSNAGQTGISSTFNTGNSGRLNTDNAGGDTAHNVMQPFLAVNYIIKF